MGHILPKKSAVQLSMAVAPQKTPPIDTEQRLNQLDNKLESVRNLYEKYFSGVLKIEPHKEHHELKSLISSLSPADIKSTATKFRLQSIQSRYLQLQKLWTKTLREIEEGTHKRELFLMEKKEEFKRNTQEQKRPDFASSGRNDPSVPDSAQMQYLNMLYDKMAQAVGKGQNLPSRDSFVKKVGSQVVNLKNKNPDKRVELRLQKNAEGKLEVKIKLQPKA